jgi:hypothetical protein
MKKTLMEISMNTESNDVSVIFLWMITHVISVVLWLWYLLRYNDPDDVIKLLYSLYALIALSFDILHLWRQHMCGKWILAQICYAFGFAPRTGCDRIPAATSRQVVLDRDVIGSNTDEYHWNYICFYIFIRIRIRIRIASDTNTNVLRCKYR